MSEYRVFLPGETLTDDELQDLGLQGTYTPDLEASTTDPTLGTGATQNGDFLLHQGFVTVGFTIQFGTSGTNAGSGTYRLTLPTSSNASPALDLGLDADWQDNRAVGQVFLSDASGPLRVYFVRTSASIGADTVVFSAGADGSSVTSTAPWTWAANDYLRGSFTYKTDFT